MSPLGDIVLPQSGVSLQLETRKYKTSSCQGPSCPSGMNPSLCVSSAATSVP